MRCWRTRVLRSRTLRIQHPCESACSATCVSASRDVRSRPSTPTAFSPSYSPDLILHSDAPQPRERLAFTLWPASTESQARTNLRQLLHNLKRALPVEGNLLAIDHFAVQWRQDPSCSVDVFDFKAALTRAASAQEESDRKQEITCLQAAAQLYEDDLLPSLYDDWIAPVREDYRRLLSAHCTVSPGSSKRRRSTRQRFRGQNVSWRLIH